MLKYSVKDAPIQEIYPLYSIFPTTLGATYAHGAVFNGTRPMAIFLLKLLGCH